MFGEVLFTNSTLRSSFPLKKILCNGIFLRIVNFICMTVRPFFGETCHRCQTGRYPRGGPTLSNLLFSRGGGGVAGASCHEYWGHVKGDPVKRAIGDLLQVALPSSFLLRPAFQSGVWGLHLSNAQCHIISPHVLSLPPHIYRRWRFQWRGSYHRKLGGYNKN